MALGGGKFTTMNKVLPGAYINFVSASGASANLSDRGIVTMPLSMDWGVENEIFEVTKGDLIKNSLKMFGYNYTDAQMKNIREIFCHASKLLAYRLTSGGTKASSAYGTAKYCGTRGNDITVAVQQNIEDEDLLDFITYFAGEKVDVQTVADASGLVDNDYISWLSTAPVVITAGVPLTGGTNGSVTGASYSAYITKIDPYAFNVIAVDTTDSTTLSLFKQYIESRRDEYGKKSQAVLYGKEADYEGVINVKNTVSDANANASSLVYWVAGAEASCEVNKSCTNMLYDGEYTIVADYTQAQLENFIKEGWFVFHNVARDVRVLTDINSLVTETVTKGKQFKKNQTIRVIDQIANDVATIFSTKYLGTVPNDADGRISLWSDIVKLHRDLERLRAIEDFDEQAIVVTKGDTAEAVVVDEVITVANAMEKLYMTSTIE